MVAERLTAKFKDADLIPNGLTLEKGNDLYIQEPFEFIVIGGRFSAMAKVRDSFGATLVHIEIYWSERRATDGECPPPPNGDTSCAIEALNDELWVTDFGSWNHEIEFVQQTIAITQPRGVQAVVRQVNADRGILRKDLLLSPGHMVGIAKWGIDSLV
ncbi:MULTISPECIES: hypothetical protein [unclassified Saccharothrix]|uniref:hypothetical protein n=1 Tax=unclassified Saccharothrix TaxID=2593673 RepID=UPI00307CC919